MELNVRLPGELRALAGIAGEEEIWYCSPYDLSVADREKICNEKEGGGNYVAVTDRRLLVFEKGRLIRDLPYGEWEEIRCENQADSGLLVVVMEGKDTAVARFSMRHLARFAYIAKGAGLLKEGKKERVVSKEPEKYCPICGRALPGTRECPRCSGRMVKLHKFLDLCRDYRGQFLAVSVFMILGSVLSLLSPEVQQRLIDEVLTDRQGTIGDIWRFIAVMTVLTILTIGVNVTKNLWCASLGARISVGLRAKLYNKIQSLSLSFMQSRKPGDLMNRVVGDTRRIRSFMEDVFGNMLSLLITMIGALVCMASLHPWLTLLSAGFVLISVLLTRMWRRRINRMFRMQWRKEDKIKSGLSDVISGMRVVKSFGREKSETLRFKRLAEEYAKTQKRNEIFWAVFYPILTFITGIGVFFATYFGGISVLDGRMTSGELMQFITYTGLLYGPLNRLTHLPRSIMQMLTSLDRIYDVLDEEPEVQEAKDPAGFEIQGEVEFKDVEFGYKTYEPVLKNISFKVKKGEMIGLVGSSGAGKSTLINLLMRLYDVTGGELLIDGTDIRLISQECLHSQIGVVLQETFLFAGTILNNIRFSKADATYEEVIRAAKAANAHDFICKMPDGYNTYVGEHGYNLSGGERQRIAIARAILNNPKLLILDEATSNLDTESEYLIQQALGRLSEGRTTFAIAHRLSTLRKADRLIVIEGHQIAEMGTHDELLAKKGIYYGLVEAQLKMNRV